jgi:quinolinate synthase
MMFQPPLPDEYRDLTGEQIATAVREHKQRFGRRLVILGHHYQQDDVIQFADFTGDSLKLSQLAAQQRDARFVVFCGVHFMAESADILTDDEVAVILPDLSAGCSMADMAAIEDVDDAWEFLTEAADGEVIVPITYVNSAASVKAFCGRNGGGCCTSGNAKLVLQWALKEGQKVLFLPDQHLGRNTAYALGHPLDSMVVFDPQQKDGGLTAEQVRDARFILWRGHCSVHKLFTVEHCRQIRRADPQMKILVHPECVWEVVQEADLAGSTEYIVRTIDQAPPGSRWAIGTENHLVHRLAQKHAGTKTIRSLAGIQCLCTTMYRISPRHLLWALDNLAAGRVVNRIQVEPETKRQALVALDRMLANVSAQPVAAK